MSALINLALLESLKARDFRDEIDLYIPFLANTILSVELPNFTPEDIAKEFKRIFGFRPPEAVLKVLLVRAKKRGLISEKNHFYSPVYPELQPYRESYDTNKIKMDASLAELIDEFKAYVDKHSGDVTVDAEDQLLGFLEKNISSLLIYKKERKSKDNKTWRKDYITASFIAEISREKRSSWDSLQVVIKGVVLANYLLFADKKAKSSKKFDFSNITVYLDTPLIVALLGYNGRISKNAIDELMKLLSSLKVNIKIFDRTLWEIEGLLDSWARDLKTGSHDRFHPSTLHLLISKRIDHSRLETERALLEDTLKENGVIVSYGFRVSTSDQCDEAGLERHLRANRAVSSTSSYSVEHDVVCISRVHNMRKGRAIRTLSEEFNVFVTSNTPLIKYSNAFLSSRLESGIPISVSDTWLTTIFWLKHQDNFGSLPINKILSEAYATLNTANEVWEDFLRRFNRLHERGDITDENFEKVRFDKRLLTAVNEHSFEVDGGVNDNYVFEIVEKVSQENEREKNDAIDAAVKSSQDALQSTEAKVNQLKKREAKALLVIRRVSKLISWVCASLLFLSIGSVVFFASFPVLGPENRILGASVSGIVTVLLTLIGYLIDIRISDFKSYVYRRTCKKLRKILLDTSGYEKDKKEPRIH